MGQGGIALALIENDIRKLVSSAVGEFVGDWLLVNPRKTPTGDTTGSIQAPQLKEPAQTSEPTVKYLSDVRPGVSRAAVLAGLAPNYDLRKFDNIDHSGFEIWWVMPKTPPFKSSEVWFVAGKTYLVSSQLVWSESPDAVSFVDAFQSALYDSSNPPTSAETEAMARLPASKAGVTMSDEQLKTGEQLQMDIWKLFNQRFGIAQIGAQQQHKADLGDRRTLSITIGARSFLIELMTGPGGSKPSVSLSEVKQQ